MSTFEQAAPAPPKTIGVGWIVLGIVMAILVIPAVLGGIAFVIAGDPDSDAAAIVAQAFFAAGLIATPFVICRIEGVAPATKRLGLRAFNLLSGIGWTLVAAVTYLVVGIFFAILFATDQEQQVVQDIGSEQDTAMLVALGVLVVGVAPVAEEVFFRGFLFGSLRGKVSVWPAALISGIFFGAIHLIGGFWQAVVLLSVLGVLLAWLYERTGSIGPPIMLHMLVNVVAFYAAVA